MQQYFREHVVADYFGGHFDGPGETLMCLPARLSLPSARELVQKIQQLAGELARVPVALVASGERDEWQTAAKLQADEVRLRAAGVNVLSLQFDGGHEWTPDFSRAVGEFLQRFD